MKKMLLAMVCLLPIFGAAQTTFTISGKLSSITSGRTVVLKYKDIQGQNAEDSVKVKNGSFELSGSTAYGNKAVLTLKPVKTDLTQRYPKRDEQIFYLENGKLQVNGTDSIATASITGTQAQREYREYSQKMDGYSAKYKRVSAKYPYKAGPQDSSKLKLFWAEIKPIQDSIRISEDAFIFSHPDSYVTLDIVALSKAHNINFQVLDPYYRILSKRVMNSFTGKDLADRYNKAKKLLPGKPLDFTQPDEKGQLFKLSSLKGKYVLVDFWASWCGPCRGEAPYLRQAYQELKSKKFEIVSVSLDQNRTAWLKAVKEDQMTWIQLCDLTGFKNKVVSSLGITSIPRNILLDPNGLIIAKDLRGENITERIAALIE